MNYIIKTYGCKLNQSDSYLIKQLLDSNDFCEVDGVEDADLVIFNTCAVVESTVDKILKEARRLKLLGKKIVLAGCIPATMPNKCKEITDACFTPTNINDVLQVIEKNEFIARNSMIDKAHYFKEMPFKKVSEIVPISEGCLGNCTYCITKLARKKLLSFNKEQIIERVNYLLSHGVKEIQLTSQDLAVYGMDKGAQDLVNLLKEIDAIDNDFKIKLGMMNPGWSKFIIKDLLQLFKSDHFYKFLHIPLQSGSNELLNKMNRGYGVEDFIHIVDIFRKSFPDTVLATDIIVGHPLENEDIFNATVDTLKTTKPDIVHIFKFSKRPNTQDFELIDFPDRIKKERSRHVTKLFHRINEERNKGFVGSIQEVLLTEKRKNSFLARNLSGRAVVLNSVGLQLGSVLSVKIIDSKWNYLLAEPSFAK